MQDLTLADLVVESLEMYADPSDASVLDDGCPGGD